jgi:hypothetical protein
MDDPSLLDSVDCMEPCHGSWMLHPFRGGLSCSKLAQSHASNVCFSTEELIATIGREQIDHVKPAWSSVTEAKNGARLTMRICPSSIHI